MYVSKGDMCLKDESKGCKEVRFYHVRTFIDICRSLAYKKGNYTTNILVLRRIEIKMSEQVFKLPAFWSSERF